MKMRKKNKFFAHLPLAEESKKAIVQPYSNFTNFPQPYKGPRKRENIKNCSFFFSNCMEGKKKDRGANLFLRHLSTMFRWIIICTVFERTCSKDGGIEHGDDDQQEGSRKFSVGSWNSEFPTTSQQPYLAFLISFGQVLAFLAHLVPCPTKNQYERGC